jgi:hypothetical protein
MNECFIKLNAKSNFPEDQSFQSTVLHLLISNFPRIKCKLKDLYWPVVLHLSVTHLYGFCGQGN